MCGIFTYFKNQPLNNHDIRCAYNALESIKHRGPDGHGILLLNTHTGAQAYLKDPYTSHMVDSVLLEQLDLSQYNCIMAQKRLSIFDLSAAGFQPMQREGSAIVYNGEVFNYPELRKKLEERFGWNFQSGTDTEVILQGLRGVGPDFVKEFIGMWSFVCWNGSEKQFIISRDRYGIKPLLYQLLDGGGWVIGSEEKEILAFTGDRPSIHLENLGIFVHYGYLSHNRETMYQGILEFPPASYMHGKAEDFGKLDAFKKYFIYDRLGTLYDTDNEEEAIGVFNYLFHDAVALRMRADVKIGAAISGGLDSSRIVFEMAEVYQDGEKPEFFSAIFPGHKENEQPFMEKVAQHLGVTPHYTYPEKEFHWEDLEKLTYHLDSPVPSPSFYAQWCVSRKVQEAGIKVLLAGQGADELFGGYHHHFYRLLTRTLLKGQLGKAQVMAKQYAQIKGMGLGHLWKNATDQIKLMLKIRMGLDKGPEAGLSLHRKWNQILDLKEFLYEDLTRFQLPFYLKAEDRVAMAFGFESRYPFLDFRMVDYAFATGDALKIHDGWQKWIIRKSFKQGPQEVIWRKDKVGYRMPDATLAISEDLYQESKQQLKKLGIESPVHRFRTASAYLWLKQYL